MAVHGSIGEYSDSIEDWTAYTERLENYFTANDVEDGSKKRAILLSVCEAATYKLIRSLAAPEKPTDYSYEALKQMVKTHHNPKPSVIVQRFKFNLCNLGEIFDHHHQVASLSNQQHTTCSIQSFISLSSCSQTLGTVHACKSC